MITFSEPTPRIVQPVRESTCLILSADTPSQSTPHAASLLGNPPILSSLFSPWPLPRGDTSLLGPSGFTPHEHTHTYTHTH